MESGVRQITDYGLLSDLEYKLQLSLFTTDLHVIKGWSLQSESSESLFAQHASVLGGPLLSSWVELNELGLSQDGILEDDGIEKLGPKMSRTYCVGSIPHPMVFQGNGRISYLLFELAPGRSLVYTNKNGEANQTDKIESKDKDSFRNAHIPDTCTSIVMICSESGDKRKMYRQIYRLKREEQILPSVIIEVELKPLRIEVIEPVCENCLERKGDIYCTADKVHLCDICDNTTHSTNQVFRRHIRISAKNSPQQFGVCTQHPSANIESVCLSCFVLLCPLCLVIGEHSKNNFSEHPIVSTIQAYQMAISTLAGGNGEQNSATAALQGGKEEVAPPRPTTNHRYNMLSQKLTEKQKQMQRIYSNFISLKKSIDKTVRDIIKQILVLGERKLNYIKAIKRNLATELLIFEWLDKFLEHLRLALNASDYLFHSHKHSILTTSFAHMTDPTHITLLPPWMYDRLHIEGDVRVTTKAPHILTLSADGAQVSGEKSASQNKDEDFANWEALNNDTYGLDLSGHVDPYTQATFSRPEEASKKHSNLLEGNILYAGEKEGEVISLAMGSAIRPYKKKNLSEKMFRILADNDYVLLMNILKTCDILDRTRLISAICHIANYLEALPNLIKHVIKYEIVHLSELPYSLLISSSSILSHFLGFLSSRYFLMNRESRIWLTQLVEPLAKEVAFHLGGQNSSQESPVGMLPDDRETLPETDAKYMARNAMEKFLIALTSFTMQNFPCTIKGILYIIVDVIDCVVYNKRHPSQIAQEQKASPPAIAFCTQIFLGSILAQYITATSQEALYPGGVLHRKPPKGFGTEGRSDSGNVLKNAEEELLGDGKITPVLEWEIRKCCSASLRYVGHTVWNVVEKSGGLWARKVGGNLSTEIRTEENSRQIIAPEGKRTNSVKIAEEDDYYVKLAKICYMWMERCLKAPRESAPLIFNKKNIQEKNQESLKVFITYLLTLDKQIRQGHFTPQNPMPLNQFVKTPNFEYLISFAITHGRL